MQTNKRVVRLTLIVTIIFLLILFYTPRKINKSLDACLYVNDSSNIINSDINLELSLHRKLFNENTVIGTITINNKKYKVNKQGYENSLKGIQSKFKEESYLLIGFEENNSQNINAVYLKVSREFNYIWGNFKEEDLTKGKKMLISAPAKNITEAKEVGNKMFFYDR